MCRTSVGLACRSRTLSGGSGLLTCRTSLCIDLLHCIGGRRNCHFGHCLYIVIILVIFKLYFLRSAIVQTESEKFYDLAGDQRNNGT